MRETSGISHEVQSNLTCILLFFCAIKARLLATGLCARERIFTLAWQVQKPGGINGTKRRRFA